MKEQRERQVVPGGIQDVPWHHMIPIAKLLIGRGHPPINYPEKFGFGATRQGMMCRLGYSITTDDWAAINEAFVLPGNIGYHQGIIRDSANWVDIIGFDEVACEDGVQPTSVWVERERHAGRL